MATALNLRTQIFVPWEAANPVVYPVPPDKVSQDEWSRARFSTVLTAWPQGNGIAVSLTDEWACRFALYLRPPGRVLAEWRASSGPGAMRQWPFAGVYDLVPLLQSCPVALAYNVGRASAEAMSVLVNPQTGPGQTQRPQTVVQNIGEAIAETGIVQAAGLSSAIQETFGVSATSPTAPKSTPSFPWGLLAGVAAGIAVLIAIFGGKRR